MSSDIKFFGEWVYFEEGNEADKEQARQYLKLWKKFMIRKLSVDLQDYEKIPDDEYGEQWIEREGHLISVFARYGTLAIKFAYRKKIPYELS